MVRPFLFVVCSEAMNELDQLVQAAKDDFSRSSAPADLENAKARYLGKAGRVTELLKALGSLSAEEKKHRRRGDQRCEAASRGVADGAPPGAGATPSSRRS